MKFGFSKNQMLKCPILSYQWLGIYNPECICLGEGGGGAGQWALLHLIISSVWVSTDLDTYITPCYLCGKLVVHSKVKGYITPVLAGHFQQLGFILKVPCDHKWLPIQHFYSWTQTALRYPHIVVSLLNNCLGI